MTTEAWRLRDLREARERLPHGVDAVASGWAPGRCTVLGDHLDYAGGHVLCCALDHGVAVALSPSADGSWSVSSDGVVVERGRGDPVVAAGDIADRPLAANEAARRRGWPTAPSHVAIAASLPRAAGLASSAAVACATLAAVLRGGGVTTTAGEFVDAAWSAEHDIVGVPCGRLDQEAVVASRPGHVLVVDGGGGASTSEPWPWPDVVLVVADSGEYHAIAGPGYGGLRRSADAVLERAGVATCGALDASHVAAMGGNLAERAAHLVAETDRVRRGREALREGDAALLGALMNASQHDQANLLRASTPTVDRMIRAARDAGCLGARLVGGGFGGGVVALCPAPLAVVCAAAMTGAARRPQASAWSLQPAAGLAWLSPQLFAAGRPGRGARVGSTLPDA